MERVGGRTAWLPAHLLWAPAMLAGLWFLTGLQVDATDVGGAWSMRVIVESPVGWFTPAWSGWTGVGLLVVGLVLRIAAAWRPHPTTFLTVSRFPAFGVAALLLWALAAVAAFQLRGHVMDPSLAGLEWRFVADLRTHWTDVAITWAAAVLGVAFYALSFAGPWKLGWLESDASEHIE